MFQLTEKEIRLLAAIGLAVLAGFFIQAIRGCQSVGQINDALVKSPSGGVSESPEPEKATVSSRVDLDEDP